MVKIKKKSSSATKVVAGLPMSRRLRSVEKGGTTKLKKRSPTEKKKIEKKKDMELGHDDETFVVHLRIIEPKILPEGSRTLYVSNLRYHSSREIMNEDFEEFFQGYGKIKVKMFFHKKDLVAEIEFESHDLAKKALKNLNGAMFIYTYVKLDISLNPKKPSPRDDNFKDRVIYVCGFGEAIKDYKLREELENHFSSCGEILAVSTPVHDEKKRLSMGYAYVQFKDVESIPRALEKDGTEFMHSSLQVRRAKVLVKINTV